jgi:hypothetical protein
MFATGAVVVHLGDIQSINTDNSMGFDYTKNDLTLKANRPAAVLFDPTIYAAAQVTLP